VTCSSCSAIVLSSAAAARRQRLRGRPSGRLARAARAIVFCGFGHSAQQQPKAIQYKKEYHDGMAMPGRDFASPAAWDPF
jgi:hypothetical protein